MTLTYKDAGVDKESGYKSVKLIKDMVQSTYNENVDSSLGGFAGLYDISKFGYKHPLLVSGTDGVGTKVEIAFKAEKHDTVGIDAVAMCVNDILCQGARPLFFLDYIASGKIKPEKIHDIVAGVVEGCHQSNAALIGGETAEMPGIYEENDYDIAGFAVGIVDKEKLIDGSKAKAGDKIIGLTSSGIHSNGFSLVRKIVFDLKGMNVDTYVEELDAKLGDALLVPTKIYVKPVLNVMDKIDVHGCVHITGGGLFENVPRVLKENTDAHIDLAHHKVPEIFELLQKWGGVDRLEMYNTFNMGLGMLLFVAEEDVDETLDILKQAGEDAYVVGSIEQGNKEVKLCNF